MRKVFKNIARLKNHKTFLFEMVFKILTKPVKPELTILPEELQDKFLRSFFSGVLLKFIGNGKEKA
ncbi:MAG: hypothetical protein ACPF9D_02155 [Owenweeksia sp.]